jgi:hypothetical protein
LPPLRDAVTGWQLKEKMQTAIRKHIFIYQVYQQFAMNVATRFSIFEWTAFRDWTCTLYTVTGQSLQQDTSIVSACRTLPGLGTMNQLTHQQVAHCVTYSLSECKIC